MKAAVGADDDDSKEKKEGIYTSTHARVVPSTFSAVVAPRMFLNTSYCSRQI